MASDSRNAVQSQRKRMVALMFRRYRKAARTAPLDEQGVPVETEDMQHAASRIWELHHAITLNEGW